MFTFKTILLALTFIAFCQVVYGQMENESIQKLSLKFIAKILFGLNEIKDAEKPLHILENEILQHLRKLEERRVHRHSRQ